jgi:hypothetical protein
MSYGDLFLITFLFLYWLAVIFVYRLSKGLWSILFGIFLVVPTMIGSVFVLYVWYFN